MLQATGVAGGGTGAALEDDDGTAHAPRRSVPRTHATLHTHERIFGVTPESLSCRIENRIRPSERFSTRVSAESSGCICPRGDMRRLRCYLPSPAMTKLDIESRECVARVHRG
jgi:hypothetical protein